MGTIPLQVRHLVRATLVDGISFYHRLDTSEHDIRPMEMTNLYHKNRSPIDKNGPEPTYTENSDPHTNWISFPCTQKGWAGSP
jgi:hypothetical protein